MNHCREEARHLFLSMQWVTGAPMNICAQAEAARERRLFVLCISLLN
jgi:hypothetical protein